MDKNKNSFQLVIIGSGSAGLSAVELTHQLGLSGVALIEAANRLGGECLHAGCVPSKALIHASEVFPNDPVKAWGHVRASIATIEQRSDNRAAVEAQGVTVFQGKARFVDTHTVQVGEELIKGKYMLIATGSIPSVPPIPGLENIPYVTNESFFALDALPKSMLIVGGGPIGCELAGALSRLGVTVTLVQRGDRLLNRETSSVSEAVKLGLEAAGVRVVLNADTQQVEKTNEGIIVRYKNPNEQEVVAEQILIAAGRTPQVAGLNLEEIGVTTSDAGVTIDTYLRTSRRNIYAIGDVTPSPKFTHLAAQQAGLALRNMLAGPFKRSTTSLSPLPAITFTTPAVARFGVDSDAAIAQKLRVERLDYTEIDRAVTDQKAGFIEVVVGKKGDIVGATIVGEHASEILSPLLVAARGGVPLSDLATTTFAYPTLASGINILASRYATSLTKQKVSFKIAARGWRKYHAS